MAYVQIEGTPDSLVPPYNKEKVAELLAAALTTGGFLPPECIPDEVGDENRQLGVQVIEGVYTAQQIAEIVAILNSVAADPTRSELTEEQQEAADLQNKLDNAIADIAVVNAVPGGLKDQINAASTGLQDRLLTNAAWNALTTDAQADLLRQVLRDTLTLMVDGLNVTLHGARADKFELRYIKKLDDSEI